NRLLYALLHRYLAARAGDVFQRLADVQATYIDASRGKPTAQDVQHLVQLEHTGRGLRHHIAFELEGGIRALEAEARRKFAIGLVNGIAQLMLVYFGDDIKRRHTTNP